jgi:hypothetical protein
MKLFSAIIFYTFLIISCTPQATPIDSTKDNTQYPEQDVIEFKNTNSFATGINYVPPAFTIGEELKSYILKNKYNEDYAFIINMRIPCYKKRFFVYNLKKDSLLNLGLVSHGYKTETFKGKLIFSNIVNSNQSSLGRYKVGVSYTGMWGFSYRLHGLDTSNSRAFERAVVMHSYPTIPIDEVSEEPIAFSYGCPMVAPAFLLILKGYISKAKKPIILSIIY